MCILAFITRHCERFPFILIGNRDEELARVTGGLTLDTSTGLVWALDRRAGGSWMGIEPRSGRFAILTNCRRSPAAPLTCSAKARDADQCGGSERGEPAQRAGLFTAAAVWRGAAPLSHICAHTTVVPVTALPTVLATAKTAAEDSRCPQHSKQLRTVTLAYDPPTSRGLVIKNFLQTGILPGDTAQTPMGCTRSEDADASLGKDDALVAALPAVLRVPPYYAGFNLLSCDDLRRCGVDAVASEHGRHESGNTSAAAPEILYTTNRYTAEHRCPVAPGQVHCLQNSYLDNMHGEPITARLGQLFTDALHRVIDPIAAEQPPSSTSGITPAMVTEVATALADECLCDRCSFDLPKMEKTAFSAAAAAALHAQLHSNNPLLGFTEKELHEYFGNSAAGDEDDVSVRFCDGGAATREAYLQSSIFKLPFRGYGTQMQSMVLVERVAAVPSTLSNVVSSASATTVIHFCQRKVSFDVATQSVVAAPWIAYRILQDGSCLRDSAEIPAP
ncbi:conserved hypothetical protein [Leishmania infantum JPCM5]|uniref:NRDE_protein_-__putative n=2 Tax=Leishmania infantum TaxID=5671 RepID=A0A6L0WLF2_LEIIN|nr:conserved hypothetical protein [Leishmania infantum JPCM5]CAC9453291.1 NRDE_protein_-__putative [Leishmania infantum]CAM65844.2 conserved hypothetical protein [Leishmania infantum JPCM5]SUZ39471.1 NRDE_protein_-__putative [Leishmania infantum]|eukprot:XP_001463479.2 conserved hypothetical protein [Leishmania infantum JPCM5]